MSVSFKTFLLSSIFLLYLSTANAQVDDASNEFSYALKLYNQSFYDLAAQQFVKYYNTYPSNSNSDEAKFYAGMSLYILKEYNKSRIEFQALALEFPKSKRAGEAWFKIGECYQLMENFADAAKSFATLKTLYPKHHLAAQALYQAGINYHKVNDDEKAKSVFSAVLENFPESAVYFKSMIQLAIVNESMNNLEQAKNHLEKVIVNSKNQDELAHAYYTKGLIDFHQGYSKTAEGSFSHLIKNYPNSSYYPLASLNLARIYLQKNEYKLAVSHLEKADQKSLSAESIEEISVLKGDAYFLNSNYAFAVEEYNKALETIDKDKSKNLFTLTSLKKALSLKKQGLADKANLLMSELISSESLDEITYQVFILYLKWLKDANKIDLAISQTLQKLKTTIDEEKKLYLVNQLAQFYISTNRWREVVREVRPYALSPVISKFKDDLVFALGTAYQNLGEYEESAYFYDTILKQYSASIYYSDVEEKYQRLTDYYIVDQVAASRKQLAILANLSMDRSSIPLAAGNIYYNDYKDYENAQIQFQTAIEADSLQRGDAYLMLGKTLLKKSEKNRPLNMSLKSEAAGYFQKAVENSATCNNPDEASWLMVQTRVLVDTVSVKKQKQYIEVLLTKYPASPLKETWLRSLAHALAFEEGFEGNAEKYFKELISGFKNSESFPSYLYGYAKLIEEKNPETANTLFKTLALEYTGSPHAVQALNEVASNYENNNMYYEASLLYSRLLEQFYYSQEAENVQNKIGELKLKANLNNEAITVLSTNIQHPFIEDIVLSKEFLSPGVKNNLVYLGIAYKRIAENEKAKNYFKKYLSLTSDNALLDIVYYELAELYFAEGRNLLALENFSNITRKSEQLYKQALLQRGDILYTTNNYPQASVIFYELSELYKGKPENEEIQGKYILCKIKIGSIKNSETLIRNYKQQYPKAINYFASFTIELGEYNRRNKNFNDALSYYKTVQKKYSKSEYIDDAEYYTALVYITLNKTKEAFEVLKGFYGKYPKSDKVADVQNTLGILYTRVERYDEAIGAFKNALKYSRDKELDAHIMGNLIKSYTMTGFWDAAQGLARKYVDEYPNAEDRLDKKMVIAQAFINLNQFQNAVDYLKRMKLEADSEREPEIQFYIGEALLKAGQYEEAIAEFVKIPLLSRKTKLQWEASALYYSGQAYEKLGRIQDAVRMYREIINRPGIDLVLKRDAEKRISQIQG